MPCGLLKEVSHSLAQFVELGFLRKQNCTKIITCWGGRCSDDLLYD
jgi:hypothetical protein